MIQLNVSVVMADEKLRKVQRVELVPLLSEETEFADSPSNLAISYLPFIPSYQFLPTYKTILLAACSIFVDVLSNLVSTL
ncbi:hypothetical protein PNOK_0614800 [Pyrrhoderma noxium]|uniref:Uncharacterized protein n=1 Tax=Pyrrhoderma noxium TaxID=2282107 RepID=A0A286UDG1_9AGAM|nr:hypothetical protein PNOK_0614800 [Pyrrhoderma noxium]